MNCPATDDERYPRATATDGKKRRRGGSPVLVLAAALGALAFPGCSSEKDGSSASGCEDGATRECVGPGACRGGQECLDGEWSACDCVDVSAGGAGAGGTPTGGSAVSAGGAVDSGGRAAASGGSDAGGSPQAGAGGETSAGGSSRDASVPDDAGSGGMDPKLDLVEGAPCSSTPERCADGVQVCKFGASGTLQCAPYCVGSSCPKLLEPCATTPDCQFRGVCYDGRCQLVCTLAGDGLCDGLGTCIDVGHAMYGVCIPSLF
jgi:hypothetical protein